MPLVENLPSGYKVVMVPCEAESVAVGIFVAAGSRDETPAFSGASHFIEHMLFKGTATRSACDISRAVEGRGGIFNAFTTEEMTCYYVHMPNEYAAEAIDILSDMYLNASMPQEEFEREKNVIIEELKMYDDDPAAVAAEKLQESMFRGCSLAVPVGGTKESVSRLKVKDLSRFKARNYRPDNTLIVIVGAFSPDKCMKMLVDVFPRRGRRRAAGKAAAASKLPSPRPSVSVVKKDVNQMQLSLGYRIPGNQSPCRYTATLADAVLGRGMSSRLFMEVREKRGLSYDVSSRSMMFRDAGMFTVSAGLDVMRAKAAYATICSQIDRLRRTPVSAAELRRTKEFITGNFRLSHERVVSKLFFYGSSVLVYGKLVPIKEQVEGILAVTPQDIKDFAGRFLAPEKRFVSWVLPSSSEAEAHAARAVVSSGGCMPCDS